MTFICDKKNAAVKRERLIETLKKEKVQLQERLNAISTGPHAQRELKVNRLFPKHSWMHFFSKFLIDLNAN